MRSRMAKGNDMKELLKKIEAAAYAGEEEGGSEIVQTVIVLGFALGLGAALLLLQGQIRTAITTAGTNLTTFFTSITAGMK